MKAFVFLCQRYTTVPLCALATILAVLFGASSFAQESPYATLTRVAFFVAEPELTITFYKDVLRYEEGKTSRNVGPYVEDNAWDIPAGSHLRLTYLKSRNGAYVAVMWLEDAALETLARPDGVANAFGDVMLIHLVRGIDEVHARAVAGGYRVIKAPILSVSGASKQIFLREPNGIRIELSKILVTAPDSDSQ